MSLLPQNETILKQRWPDVLDKIKTSSPTETLRTETSHSIEFTTPERQQHPYGNQNTKQTITRWIKQLNLEDNTCYALGGFGSGFHIEQLLESTPTSTCFFIGEKDPARLKLAFSKRDCTQLLKSPRIQLAAGSIDDHYFEKLNGWPLVNFTSAHALQYTPLQVNDEIFYLEYFKLFAENFRYNRNLHRVGIGDSGFWQATTLKNLPHLINAPDVGITKNWFSNLPLVLVAAGPSLDDSIAFLKAIQGKALIVCVNSAYQKLFNNGIQPHITVAGDPRQSTYRGYASCDTSNTFLMAPSYVHPEVVKKFTNRTFTWCTNNELLAYINKQLSKPLGTPILEQGTVSACIVDLAQLWGCTKICLVGQDMALTHSGESHTKDSFYADKNHALYLKLQDCQYLPGNTLKTVPVHARFLDFLKTFNEFPAKYPTIDFINVSTIGAKIKDVPYKTYEEALDWIGERSSTDVREKLKDAISSNSQTTSPSDIIHQSLSNLIQFIDKLNDLTLSTILKIEMLSENLAQPNYETNKNITACLKASEEILTHFNKFPDEQRVLLDGHTKRTLYAYIKALHSLPQKSPHWDSLQQNKEYFWALASGGLFLKKQIDRCLDELS